jgi:hypothetical protein
MGWPQHGKPAYCPTPFRWPNALGSDAENDYSGNGLLRLVDAVNEILMGNMPAGFWFAEIDCS